MIMMPMLNRSELATSNTRSENCLRSLEEGRQTQCAMLCGESRWNKKASYRSEGRVTTNTRFPWTDHVSNYHIHKKTGKNRNKIRVTFFVLFSPLSHWLPVNLLHRHVAHDGPLVSLERLSGHEHDLVRVLGAELLGGVPQHLLVRAVDLHLE